MSDFLSPQDIAEMPQAGFQPDEIDQARQRSMQEMAHSGFSTDEVQKYYGVKDPDMTPAKRHVQSNIKLANAPAPGATPKPKQPHEPVDSAVQPVEAKDILDGLAAGWGTGFTGLFTAGQKSPIAVAENASRAVKIASMVGQFVGDIPAMAAGATAGAALGTVELPVVGTVGGATAGAFAAPAAMRKMLTEQYEKGEISSAGDFADRVMAASWEGMKGAVTGVATEVTGGLAKGYVGTIGKLAAEASTMATVSSALEGHLPSQDDFINGLVMMGGFHAIGVGMPKMFRAYERTGLKPEDVVDMAQTDPILKQEVLSVGDELPKSLEPLAEKEVQAETPKERALPEEPDELKKARENVAAKIGFKEETKSKWPGLKDMYQNYVDRLNPVADFRDQVIEKGETLAANEDPYKLMRMANDAPAKAKHAIEEGTLDYKTLEKNGKGLTEILDPMKGKEDQFEQFLVSKRALEIEKSGRESGFDVGDVKQIIKADKGEFNKAAKEVVDFQNRNLEYLRDSGRISNKLYDTFVKMGKSFVPFARLLDPVEDFEGLQKPGSSNSLKRLRGSDLAVQHPVLSIMENTEKMFTMAEQNRAKVSLVELAEKKGIEKYFKKVPGNKLIKVDALPEVNKLLEDIGMDPKDLDLEEFNVFRSQEKALAANQFEVWRDGKREVYELQDERVAKAVKSLEGNPSSQLMVMKLARWFTGLKRIGTTLVPDFILKNFTRDQLTAGVFSQYGTLPFTHVLAAMGDLWQKNDHYYNWLKSGGANGAFLDLNTKYLQDNVFKLDKETGFIQNMQNVLKDPSDIIQLAQTIAQAPKQGWQAFAHAGEFVGNIIESAPRLAEFKRASEGASSGPKVFEGGFQSREITVDFQRMGLKTQALNSIAAFMNAQVQGLDRTVRAFKDDPTGTSIKAAAYLTGPTILLWAMQKDDPRYQEIPQWEKDLFWCVVHHNWQPAKDGEANGLPDYMVKDGMVDRGIIFRIPKPQELGLLFATVPERILESFLTDHPDAYRDLGKTIQSLLVPNWMPDIAAPIAESMTNYNMFTSRPLVPQYLENQLPAYRYTEFTSDTAKAIGKVLGTIPVAKEMDVAAPIEIENFVKGWGGQLGTYLLQLVDKGLRSSGAVEGPEKPAWTVADIPFVKAFIVRNPTTQAESIQRFYDKAKIMGEILNTTKIQMKLGHDSDVAWIQSNYGQMEMKLDGFKKALSTQGKVIRGINESDYTPDDKRQLIEKAYYDMIEVSKFANSTIDQYEKLVKTMKEGK